MKTHEVVMSWVAEELDSGRLAIGDHLPAERTLAATLHMSRSSVREAMRVLEALGTIRTSTGSGPASGTILTSAPAQAFTLALRHQLAAGTVASDDVNEVRLLLEAWAARHSDPALLDIPRAEDLLARMDDSAASVETFLELDAEFHVTLARAVRNPLISSLMDGLRTAIAAETFGRACAIEDWPATARRLRAEHREIFDQLRSGNGERAANLLHAHISGYYRETGGRA